MASFLHLAEALLEVAGVEARATARLAEHAPEADLLEALRRREKRVIAAAKLIAGLVPHERIVTTMLEIGTLVSFPDFSHDTRDLRAGNIVLLRALLGEVYAREAQARIVYAGRGISHSLVIDRVDIVGVEREPPTMFPGTLTQQS